MPVIYALVCVLLFYEFVLGPGMLLGTDTLATGYFARNFYTQFVRAFRAFPLWDPLLFGGLPFIDGMHGDIFYPPSLSLFFMNAAQAWGWKMVLHVFLAGIFTYLFLRELGLRRETALFGGLVYMMGADLVSLVYPGGDGKLFVSALAPLAFLLTERALTRRRLSDYALLALGVSLLIFTSHMQLAYFAIWGISLYAIFRLWMWGRAEKKPVAAATHFGAFALAGLLGVGAAAVQFFPPLGYLRTYSHRAEKTLQAESPSAYEYSTTYSLHPEEIVSLAVPEFVGDDIPHEDGRGSTYWGRNPFKINHEFAGFIPLFLAPLLFLRRRSALGWFFAALGVLALLYALGANTPAFRLFYLIPGVKLFRAPSLTIFLYGLSLAVLAAFAVERALSWAQGPAEDTRAARRYLWIATGILALLAALAASGVLTQVWRGIFYGDLAKVDALAANTPFIARGFGLAFMFALLVTGVWEGLARKWFGAGTALALIALLAFVDLYRVDRPFIKSTTLINSPSSPLFVADEGTAFLRGRQQAGEVFRAVHYPALQNRMMNLLAVHGVEQLAGHHGNEIGRYRELTGGDSMANMDSTFRLLDLTNTAYIVVGGLLDQPGFVEAYRGNNMVVYRREAALPRAYLVGQIEVVADSNAVRRLLDSGFDHRSTALLPEPLPAGVQIQPGPQGTVEWVDRTTPNSLRLRVQSDRPALLMLLDNYYPMWQAEVDGQPVEILRANYTFRAIPIAAGQHEVQFRYVPSNVRTPAFASAFLLVLLGGIGLGPLIARRLRKAPSQVDT
ncbi:MAG: YfhO family protein [Longimicrobiales bacterium]